MITTQRIFAPGQFIEALTPKYPDLERILVYYFHDKIKTYTHTQGGYRSNSTVYLIPLAVAGVKEQGQAPLDMAKLREEYGEDFGIKFTTSRDGYLTKRHKVNILEISMHLLTYEKDGETKEYHPCRSIINDPNQKDILDHIEKKYYKTAKTFTTTRQTTDTSSKLTRDEINKLIAMGI